MRAVSERWAQAGVRKLGRCIDGRRVTPSGVIHVGGHHGEEADYYVEHGVGTVVWFEADPDAAGVLRRRVEVLPGHHCIQALASDGDGEPHVFYRHRFGRGTKRGFCSMLPWNQAVVSGDAWLSRLETFDVATMHTVRVATALRDRGFRPEQFQYASINVQGAELAVLRGLQEYLEPIQWIYCEAELDAAHSRYVGAPTMAEVVDWLGARGFAACEAHGARRVFYRTGVRSTIDRKAS